MTEIIEPLNTSRQFELNRRVALSDTDPSGRLRIDACARYLQDVAAFDALDADISQMGNWVLRQNSIFVSSLPSYGQEVKSKTYLTGSGRAWVERTSIISDLGSGTRFIAARAIWVLTSLTSGAPISVPGNLYKIYGPLALQHRVNIRDAKREMLPGAAKPMAWQIRYSDQDILSHLNNATYLEALEEVVYQQGIKLGKASQMTCQIVYRESTSWEDPSDIYFALAEEDGHSCVSVYFAKSDIVRTSINLRVLN
ncbi:MAG: thioesterase [Candidatus Marsarchaeota archaeon]|nr:thioesterase [Candidatus Marsarchaeota archaeon]